MKNGSKNKNDNDGTITIMHYPYPHHHQQQMLVACFLLEHGDTPVAVAVVPL
jgi:hypothetical protein